MFTLMDGERSIVLTPIECIAVEDAIYRSQRRWELAMLGDILYMYAKDYGFSTTPTNKSLIVHEWQLDWVKEAMATIKPS